MIATFVYSTAVGIFHAKECDNNTNLLSYYVMILLLRCNVFAFQSILPYIERMTGFCVSDNVVVPIHNKRKCIKSGYEFYSFDISGHGFLMVYCTLTLMEEARRIKRYIKLGEAIDNNNSNSDDTDCADDNSADGVNNREADKFRNAYLWVWPIVLAAYMWTCVLCLLWDTIVIITTVYYHTLVEKVIGILLGVVVFAFLYKQAFVKMKVL